VAFVSAPPVLGEAAAAFSSTPLPAAAATPLAISTVTGFSIKPDSSTVPELFSAFVRRTGWTEFAARFPNGVTRVYRRVVTTLQAVVGPCQERRRRAMAVETVRRLFPSIDAAALASTMRFVCGVARATGGVAVAPYHRLSAHQQLEFKVANRISGVTWTRVRAFLGGAASVLASREVLRRASDLAAAEDRNRVTTMADGAFLVIPRAAVQDLLDDIVSSQHFLECPVSDGVSSAPARDCASGQTAASGGGLADASTGPPPQKASGGRCVASLSASDSDASDWSDASKPLGGTSTGSGRVHSPRSADGSPGGGGTPHCTVGSLPVWSGVVRVVAEHRHVRQDPERMGFLLSRHSQPCSCALEWTRGGGRALSRSILALQFSPVHPVLGIPSSWAFFRARRMTTRL